MATSKKSTTKKALAAKASKPAARSKPVEAKAPAKSKSSSKPVAKPQPERKTAPAAKAPRTPAPPRRVAAPERSMREVRVEKPAPAVVVPPQVIEPPKPAKPAVDAEWMAAIRDAMVVQRQELLSVVSSTQAQMAEKTGDLPDVSDRASEGFEDELAVGLIAIEAAKLDDIEAAIQRIDDGSYGLCLECRKAVPRKRLEVLPFARRCLTCEGEAERRVRAVDESIEEDDSD